MRRSAACSCPYPSFLGPLSPGRCHSCKHAQWTQRRLAREDTSAGAITSQESLTRASFTRVMSFLQADTVRTQHSSRRHVSRCQHVPKAQPALVLVLFSYGLLSPGHCHSCKHIVYGRQCTHSKLTEIKQALTVHTQHSRRSQGSRCQPCPEAQPSLVLVLLLTDPFH
jgi:hypothetical protein